MDDFLKNVDFVVEVNKYISDKVENKYEFLRRVIKRINVLKKVKEFEKEKIVPEYLINSAINDVIKDKDSEIPEMPEEEKIEAKGTEIEQKKEVKEASKKKKKKK